MNRKRIKSINAKWILLPLCVLLAGCFILHVAVFKYNAMYTEHIRTKARLNAVTYAERMTEELNGGVGITKTLKYILIGDSGRQVKLENVVEDLLPDYVQSVQLAPDGVVTDIYPKEGNESGKIDLIHDKERGPIAKYGRDNNMVIMQGPFQLNQGGTGIAIRNPVYMLNNDGEKYFWGFTIVIIKTQDIFNDSISALADFGYDYVLSKTESPFTSEYKVVAGSQTKLEDPVSYTFELGGCLWKLDVMPENGWSDSGKTRYIILYGAIAIALVEVLVFIVLRMEKQGRMFRKLSITDSLTGLLNRNGFNERVDAYLNSGGAKKCVAILFDIDNFKFINDIYEHATGDIVLCQIATDMKKTFADNAIIGRNGGDEFCLLLKDCDEEAVKQQIEAFTMAYRSFEHKGEAHKFSISLGYVEYPTYAQKGSELLRYADMALYEVKLRGKHGCLPYRASYRSSDSKRSQLGFKLNDISKNLPGAFFIYKADKADERILFANHEMLKLTGCDSFDEFTTYTDGRFEGLVHPDDYNRVEEEISRQISVDENRVNDYVKYRLMLRNGGYRNVLDYGRIINNENYGQIFYVFIVDYDFIKEHYK